MKKVLSMLVLLAWAGAVFAQDLESEMSLALGVIAGAGIDHAWVTDSKALSGTGYDVSLGPNFGWSGGLRLDADFKPYLGAEFNVLVASMGFAETASVKDSQFVTSRSSSLSIESNLMARPQYPLKTGSLYGLLGLGVQFEVGEATVQADGSTAVKYNNTPSYSALNLPVGAGYQMPVGGGKLSFDARYNLPLVVFSKTANTGDSSIYRDSSVPATDDSGTMTRLSALRLMVGYSYLF